MTRGGRAFARVELTARFQKSYAKLSAARQTQCDDALAQLVEEPVSPSLRLKPILPKKNYLEARINQGDRLIICTSNSVAYVMDVVTHDEITRWGSVAAPAVLTEKRRSR